VNGRKHDLPGEDWGSWAEILWPWLCVEGATVQVVGFQVGGIAHVPAESSCVSNNRYFLFRGAITCGCELDTVGQDVQVEKNETRDKRVPSKFDGTMSLELSSRRRSQSHLHHRDSR